MGSLCIQPKMEKSARLSIFGPFARSQAFVILGRVRHGHFCNDAGSARGPAAVHEREVCPQQSAPRSGLPCIMPNPLSLSAKAPLEAATKIARITGLAVERALRRGSHDDRM